jgi:hypothetical protein
MKYLEQSGRTNLPAIQQPSAPTIIVIPESALQHYPFQSGSTPLPFYQHPQEPTRTRDRRLDDLISSERDYLADVFDDFLLAIRRFCGALISWVLWRVVVPIAVIGVLIAALA